MSSVFSVFVKFFWKLNSKPGSVPGTGWKSIWDPSLSMYGSVSEVMTSLNTMVESEKQLNLNVTNMYVIVNQTINDIPGAFCNSDWFNPTSPC